MAENTSESPTASRADRPTQALLPAGRLSEWPWLTFLLPLFVFMLATSFEPTPPPAGPPAETEQESPAETSSESPAELPAEEMVARTSEAPVFEAPGDAAEPFFKLATAAACYRKSTTATIRTSIPPRSC